MCYVPGLLEHGGRVAVSHPLFGLLKRWFQIHSGVDSQNWIWFKTFSVSYFSWILSSLGCWNLCLVPKGCRRKNACPRGHQQPTRCHHSAADFSPRHPPECARPSGPDPLCLRHDLQEQQSSRGHPETRVWGCWAGEQATPRLNTSLELNRSLPYKGVSSVLAIQVPSHCWIKCACSALHVSHPVVPHVQGRRPGDRNAHLAELSAPFAFSWCFTCPSNECLRRA